MTELSSPSQPPYHVYCLQTCNGKFQVYIPPSPDGVWVIHTGKHTLYFICHTEPVRLAEHLRGTRKSGPKDKTVLFTVSFRLHVWGDWGTCPTAISAFSDRCAAGSPCCLYTFTAPPCLCTSCSLNRAVSSAVFLSAYTIFVPHAHWDAYGRGSLPLHHPVSDSANPLTTCQNRYRSHLWDHRTV